MTAESGIISEPLLLLENMLAAGTNFQTWVGAEDAAEAKAFIHHHEYLGATYPAAVIGDQGITRVPIAIDTWVSRGVLELWFQDEIDAGDLDANDDVTAPGLREVFTKFGNALGPIIEDLEVITMSGGYLSLTEPGIVPAEGGRGLDDHNLGDKRIIWQKYELNMG